jgi:Protein of unknown function (DUF1360)
MTVHDEKMEGRSTSDTLRAERSYSSYALLIFLYNLIFGGFVLVYRKWKHPLDTLTALDLSLLGLATLRASKLVSEDEITSVLREPVLDEVDGQKIPHGTGFRRSLGKLLLCPTCTGTWVAAFFTYALYLFPRYTRPFLAVMAASGISQTSDALLSLVYTDRDLIRQRKEKAWITPLQS